MSKAILSLAAAVLVASQGLAAPLPRVAQPPSPGFRLLATSEERPAFWVPAEVVDALSSSELEFIDLTEFQEADPSLAPAADSLPAGPTHQAKVKPFLDQIDMGLYESNLITFSTAFKNRYYSSDYGVQSSAWLLDLAQQVAANRSDITVTSFPHTFKQPSVIARIEGTSSSKDMVILGAHQDSTAPGMPTGTSPGADDDGSGSMGIMEIFRILSSNNFKPERPIEFHWYAAEEVGLLGSQDVAKTYQSRGASVRSMIQLDMIAYDGKESTVGIVTDYVDADTIAFNRKLVDEYLSIGWTNTVCGYGCSDHASWNRYGYRSSFPFEAQFRNRNPLIHTAQDSMSLVSLEHAKEFVKLGLAFAVELSYL